MNNKSIIGYSLALGATALWSGNFIVARGLSDAIPPVTLAFLRWIVAIIIFTPFAFRQTAKDWKIIKNNISYLIVLSIFGVTVFNTLMYIAGQTTTALNLSLISITFPIFIIVISRIIFLERFTLFKLIGILLVVFGVILIITKGELSTLKDLTFNIGDFWMLLAAISFAAYSILIKRKPKEIGIYSFQYASFIIGVILLLPFYIYEYLQTPSVEFNSEIIISIFYIGICASLIAFIFWNKAILLIGPSKSGMIYYSLPLFSGTLAWIILNEKIGMIHFISGVLIISGILISNYNIDLFLSFKNKVLRKVIYRKRKKDN
ncbi:MAG: DMT family transporter [Cyclobacteriaceae bacterium]|nr:DMT family transporter [Cyclobacteriaceae bacterium]